MQKEIPIKDSWTKEFDKQFCYSKGHVLDGLLKSGLREENVKSFIRSLLSSYEKTYKAEVEKNISMLRQWLNEDRITDSKKLVTNEDIKHWLLKEIT